MDVPRVLDSIFEPHRERLSTVAFRALDEADALIALSVTAGRDHQAMDLMSASNRGLTILRRDNVVNWLQRVYADTDVTFIAEHSWINAHFPSPDANVRLRVKRFDGDEGEQNLAATQLRLVASDVADLDVTLGWKQGPELDWVAYLAYVASTGECEWTMVLDRPASAGGTVRSIGPVTPDSDLGAAKRVRRADEAPTADDEADQT